MKKFLAALFCATAFLSYAQPDEGVVYLSGNLGFNASTTTITSPVDSSEISTSVANFNFGVNAGYLLNENFGVGLNLGISTAAAPITIDTASIDNNVTFYTVGPNARYYLELDRNLYLNLNFAANFSFASFEQSLGEISQSLNLFNYNVGITPGISYFVTDNLSLDVTGGFFGLGGDVTTTNQDLGNGDSFETTTSSSNFGLDLSMSALTVGVTFLIGA